MRRQPEQLSNMRFDVAVIGGGIYGACIARDAALRGLSVALIDRGDFGSGTTHQSLKIIHGGFRYLQSMDLRRLRESVHEQRYWLWAVPHNVRPMKCVLPAESHGVRRALPMAAALKAYALLGWDRNQGLLPERRLPPGALLSSEAMHAHAPQADAALWELGGVMWYDAQVQDADRLLLSCVQDAVDAGAVAVNYVEAQELSLGNRSVRGVRCKDRESGLTFEIDARVTVNACGPLAAGFLNRHGDLLAAYGRHGGRTRLARCTNIVVRDLGMDVAFGINAAALPGQPKRALFVTPWRGCSVVGTSNHACDGESGAAGEGDVRFLVDAVNAALPGAGLGTDDVLYRYTGLMPAEGGSGRNVELASRGRLIDHQATDRVDNLITVIGEKLTTARRMAERVVDLVLGKLGLSQRPCTAAVRRLPGGDGFTTMAELERRACREHRLRPGQALRELLESYGTSYPQVLWSGDFDLRSHAAPGWERLFQRRSLHAIRHEMAIHLEDLVYRRSDLLARGLLSAPLLGWAATLMAGELGWSEQRRREELEQILLAHPRLRAPTAPCAGQRHPGRVLP